MRWGVVSYYIGVFLKIFSAIVLVPIFVGRYYGESFVQLEPFLLAAFLAIVLGVFFSRIGVEDRPEALEAMMIATMSWIFAVGIAAIPLIAIAGLGLMNAYFEAMSGLTTTGMSMLADKDLPHSLLFWRSFIQWVGGLGILTFFVGVLVEAGGVASRLAQTEANKTSSGSIHPSLFNSIKAVWYVYIVFTIAQLLLLDYFGVPRFHAITTALATMPTGGYASVNDFAAMLSPAARNVITLFMFFGGTNFLLLYALLKGDVKRIVKDFEFRLYVGITLAASALVGISLYLQGYEVLSAIEMGLFHTAAIISSTGFMLIPMEDFVGAVQALFLALMFVGASLGSTTGGIKMLRLGVMAKTVIREIRGLTLPHTAVNEVVVNGKILNDREITNIVAIIFLWLAVIVLGAFITVTVTAHPYYDAAQLMASSVGTMGPTIISQAELIALPPIVKLFMMLSMLAGRLELLPLLALLNAQIARKLH